MFRKSIVWSDMAVNFHFTLQKEDSGLCLKQHQSAGKAFDEFVFKSFGGLPWKDAKCGLSF